MEESWSTWAVITDVYNLDNLCDKQTGNRGSFLPVLEAGKLEIKPLSFSCCGGLCSWLVDRSLHNVSGVGQEGWGVERTESHTDIDRERGWRGGGCVKTEGDRKRDTDRHTYTERGKDRETDAREGPFLFLENILWLTFGR